MPKELFNNYLLPLADFLPLADLENGGVCEDGACCHHYTFLLLQDPY
ncbi:MAG: hypothetical protein QOK64_02120 [Nitrososphaeraceae archaeon]|nr:hypothetical protein [Nitrososphaeraceae archaeon]